MPFAPKVTIYSVFAPKLKTIMLPLSSVGQLEGATPKALIADVDGCWNENPPPFKS